MGISQFDPAAKNRVSWNFGVNVGPKRPFTQKQIWAIRFFLDREQRLRDRALFDLAINCELRGCDLVPLQIGYVVSGLNIRKRAAIYRPAHSKENHVMERSEKRYNPRSRKSAIGRLKSPRKTDISIIKNPTTEEVEGALERRVANVVPSL